MPTVINQGKKINEYKGQVTRKIQYKIKKQFGFVNHYLQVDVYKKGLSCNMDSTSLFYVHPNYFNQKIISLIDERL